jgi:hypothetical protein
LTTIPALYTPHTVGLAYVSFVLIEVKIFTVVAYCLGMMTSCTFFAATVRTYIFGSLEMLEICFLGNQNAYTMHMI